MTSTKDMRLSTIICFRYASSIVGSYVCAGRGLEGKKLAGCDGWGGGKETHLWKYDNQSGTTARERVRRLAGGLELTNKAVEGKLEGDPSVASASWGGGTAGSD
jgi:hypothetical protein